LIAGDRDTTTLPEASEHMQRTLPRAELALIGPAKHMGLLERHHEYNQAVRAFAKRCFDATPAQLPAPIKRTPSDFYTRGFDFPVPVDAPTLQRNFKR
jgi:hypothetical protein